MGKQGADKKPSFIEIHRRRQILENAVQMISTIGYQQTTLAKIADQAGISKGVIFYYFKNKEELIQQTGALLLEELRAHTIDRMKAHSSRENRMKAYVEAYFDFIKKNRDKFLILMEVGSKLSAGDKDSIFGAEEYSRCRRRLSRIIEKDRGPATTGRAAAEALPAVIQGMLDGVGIQWVSDMASVDLDACQDLICEMIDGYLGCGAAKEI